MFLVLRCDSRAAVGDAEFQHVVTDHGRHRNLTVFGCELDGVRQQIIDDEAQFLGISEHRCRGDFET
jgi:hypothetical protein